MPGTACLCSVICRPRHGAGAPASKRLESLFFGVGAIGVALTLNIRNSKWGYWINLGILALADTGLIFFVLIPGYWSWWPGLAGPILWVAGLILTTLAYIRDVPPGENRGHVPKVSKRDIHA